MRLRWLIGATAVLAAGCYSAKLAPCAAICAADSDCAALADLGTSPTCDHQRCTLAGQTCAPVADGGVDADAGPPFGQIAEIAAGQGFACARDGSGQLACWGDNRDQVVATSGPAAQPTPVRRPGTWTQISAGGGHVCGLQGSALFCWGRNTTGECGALPVPGTPAGTTPIAGTWDEVAAGRTHTCARSGGQVLCWGAADAGQLATAPGLPSATPVAIQPPPAGGWLHVWAGDDVSCASASDGLYCWGDNKSGRINAGSLQLITTPTLVLPGAAPSKVAIGHDAACALSPSGDLDCWGDNGRGAVGIPLNISGITTAIHLGSGYADVTAGFAEVCSTDTQSNVQCWGAAEAGGLGDGVWADHVHERNTASVGMLAHTTLGDARHTGASSLDDNDLACGATGAQITCWGNNAFGQLGTGVLGRTSAPVSGIAGPAKHLVAGRHHACAMFAGGAVQCWGTTVQGQTDGLGGTGSASAPCTVASRCDHDHPIAAPAPAIADAAGQLAAGHDHTCAFAGTTATCWGANTSGQLGDPDPAATMTATTIADRVGVLASAEQSCLVGPLGSVRCAGHVLQVLTLTVFNGITEYGAVAALAFDEASGGVLRTDGSVVWTGSNANGEFGDNGTTSAGSGSAVMGPHSYRALAMAETGSTCGIGLPPGATGNEVTCWGNGASGGVPGGQPGPNPTPLLVSTATCSALAAGGDQMCEICGSGQLSCWGGNALGQAGPPRTPASLPMSIAPVQGSAWSEVAAGTGFTCAIDSAGAVECWGDGLHGELGNGGGGANVPGRRFVKLPDP